MSRDAVFHLSDNLDRLIDYCRKEYEMTFAEVVGCLMMKAHLLMQEASEQDEEEF